jgi:hypothetical protein
MLISNGINSEYLVPCLELWDRIKDVINADKMAVVISLVKQYSYAEVASSSAIQVRYYYLSYSNTLIEEVVCIEKEAISYRSNDALPINGLMSELSAIIEGVPKFVICESDQIKLSTRILVVDMRE